MRIDVSRRERVPAFELSIADLENLIEQIKKLWGANEPRVSLEIYQQNKILAFDSIAELRDFQELPKRVTDFALSLWSRPVGHKTLSIEGRGLLGTLVTVTGDSEAWCAGLVDAIRQFLRGRKKWYSSARIWAVALALVTTIFFSMSFTARTAEGTYLFSAVTRVSLSILLVVLTAILMLWGRVFPPMTLLVRREDNWLRRYSMELIVLLTAITAVATVIGAVAVWRGAGAGP